MKLTPLRTTFGAIGLALVACSICRADLFVTRTNREVLRIDSSSGEVRHVYPFPPWIVSSPGTSVGLAFDGRFLYMSHRLGIGAPEELSVLDVAHDFWFLPEPIDTFSPFGPVPLVGLGFLPDEFGGSLIGVSQHITTPDAPPSYIFQYPVFPGLPGPYFNVNFPPGELPLDMAATGADIDPSTGNLWISADQIIGETRIRRLLRADLTGAILETVTPDLPPVTLVRGVGFDAGSMFIAGRTVGMTDNSLFEIDPATGAVVRSFTVPGTSPISALTGGQVIPEPSAAILAGIALGCVTTRWRLRRAKERKSLTLKTPANCL